MCQNKIRIYNGVDVNRYANLSHTLFSGETVLITMAGRITESKGQLQCLKELIPVLQERENVRIQFAGTGKEKDIEGIYRLIENAGLRDGQVKVLGFVSDMSSLWGNTDIAIVYSQFEAFGRVTIEAKMSGALVLGFDSGGTSELIEDQIDGYLFGRQGRGLSETVNLVLSNTNEARRIAAEGREKAIELFSSTRNADEIYDLYCKVLQNTP